jgi:hypothetical protein
MNSEKWQAIHFAEGQTVKEFTEQFANLDPEGRIKWSSLGGIFEGCEPSPHDGRVHVTLPIQVSKEVRNTIGGLPCEYKFVDGEICAVVKKSEIDKKLYKEGTYVSFVADPDPIAHITRVMDEQS